VELRKPQTGDLGLMVTVGPGVTVGLMLLRW
jgi:predicted naringenin-chalcone synthase